MARPWWRTLARRAGWSILVVVSLLLATAFGFLAYATLRQTKAYDEAAPEGGHYVPAGDVEVHAQARGPPDGPVVLFIHGTGAWSGLWLETMDALAAEGYRAVAIDLPPFGFSQRPPDGAYSTADQARRILAVLDAMGATNVTLVAHSFGARAGMEAVLAEPSRFARVVLVDAALDLDGEPGKQNALVKGALAVPLARHLLVASTVENPLLTRAFLKLLIHNDAAATDERVRILQQPLVQEGLTRDAGLWLRTFLAPEPPSASNDPEAYRRLAAPVVLVWGDRDTTSPLDRGVALSDLLPNARLVVLRDVGHIPQIEAPAEFQAALLDALSA